MPGAPWRFRVIGGLYIVVGTHRHNVPVLPVDTAFFRGSRQDRTRCARSGFTRFTPLGRGGGLTPLNDFKNLLLFLLYFWQKVGKILATRSGTEFGLVTKHLRLSWLSGCASLVIILSVNIEGPYGIDQSFLYFL